MITAATQLCMVIGHPVHHSLSPAMHNAGYKSLGIDSDFVYVGCDVEPDEIAGFVKGVRAMGVRGVSCTMPHKEIIMPFLDEIDPVARKIGAVNTVVNESGKLLGYNTDWIGTVGPLKQTGSLKGKKVALLGAGGAARAMMYSLTREGAVVTVYNRTLAKARQLAREFNGLAESLDNPHSVKEADIVCNATSIGMRPESSRTPIHDELLHSGQTVLDAIYVPYETRLLKEAKAKGCRTIHGTEMLLWQAMAQFRLYTVQEAPEQAMRKALLEGIGQ